MNPPSEQVRHVTVADDGIWEVRQGDTITLTFHTLKAALKWASHNIKCFPYLWGINTYGRREVERVDL
jgi:hypothetical protein